MSLAPIRSLLALVTLSLSTTAVACSADENPLAPPAAEETTESSNQAVLAGGQPGSHVGVHGMVLFGAASDRLYVSHIPTFGAPHNFQVIAEVRIAGGVPADQQDFATKQFTVRPTAFSLYDMANGTLRSVTGTIHMGNFETQGPVMHRNVQFSVERVVFARPLARSTPLNRALEYVAVGTPEHPYLVHVIDTPSSFDQILNAKPLVGGALDATELAAGTIVTVQGGQNAVRQRAYNGDVLSLDGAGGVTSMTVGSESYCLVGADFFNACPAAQ